jgi:dTDP-4-dehydrorhamnose reductase
VKILVIGCNGQLGKSICDVVKNLPYEIKLTSRNEIDISNLKETRKKIIDYKPRIIINASAYTAVDNAEKFPKDSNLINNIAVDNLASICNEINGLLFHVSTDYVFDGFSKKPYTEYCKTNPQSEYGESKLLGEIAIKKSNCNYIILRTSWVFSEYGSNFLKTMLNLSHSKNELRIVNDQIGCPTYAKDIALLIFHIISKLDDNINVKKLYHFSGDEQLTWFSFAKLIFKVQNKLNLSFKSPRLIPVDSNDLNFLAARPQFSVLDSSQLKKEYHFKPMLLKQAIKKSIKKIHQASNIH